MFLSFIKQASDLKIDAQILPKYIFVGLNAAVIGILIVSVLIKCFKKRNTGETTSRSKKTQKIIIPSNSTVIQHESENQTDKTSIFDSSESDVNEKKESSESNEGEIVKQKKHQNVVMKNVNVRRNRNQRMPAQIYRIREKIFSFGSDFVIKNGSGQAAFYVRSKPPTIGNKLVLEDMHGRALFKIEKQSRSYWKTFKIFSAQNNRKLATVKEKPTLFFGANFSINSVYGNYYFHDDTFSYSFKLVKNGRNIAAVDKEFMSFSYTYDVKIVGGEDHAFIIALVIVIDQFVHEKSIMSIL
uniref:Uncharacterized protein n=1 Tax=Panagrolaimus sp. ES5 TaxID=591445 RepID=A0AC34FKY8_9BILA